MDMDIEIGGYGGDMDFDLRYVAMSMTESNRFRQAHCTVQMCMRAGTYYVYVCRLYVLCVRVAYGRVLSSGAQLIKTYHVYMIFTTFPSPAVQHMTMTWTKRGHRSIQRCVAWSRTMFAVQNQLGCVSKHDRYLSSNVIGMAGHNLHVGMYYVT